MLPTALTEISHSTPSVFMAKMLARGIDVRRHERWPRPCRGRKATVTSCQRPINTASEGSPKGVVTETSSMGCNSHAIQTATTDHADRRPGHRPFSAVSNSNDLHHRAAPCANYPIRATD